MSSESGVWITFSRLLSMSLKQEYPLKLEWTRNATNILEILTFMEKLLETRRRMILNGES